MVGFVGTKNTQSEFVSFLVAGAINTILSYMLYFLLLDCLGYILAYSVSYIIGIAISYFLNVYFVFKSNASVSSFIKFPIVYVTQYVFGVGILWLLVDRFVITPSIALVVVIVATTPVTFSISRFVLKN